MLKNKQKLLFIKPPPFDEDCIYPILLQAVVDDKQKLVEEILKQNPNLLLKEPDKNCVIESQYTWQKIYAEKILIMAIKRGQLEMVELILRYFKQVIDYKFEIAKQYEVAMEGRKIIEKKVKECESELKLLIDEIKKGKKRRRCYFKF